MILKNYFRFDNGIMIISLKKRVFFKGYLFILGCAGSLLLVGFSLVVESGGYSLAAVCRLFIVVASLVAECRL